jgi:hypothetical protein
LNKKIGNGNNNFRYGRNKLLTGTDYILPTIYTTINNSFIKSSRGPIHIADKNDFSRNLFNLHYCFPLYFEADGGGGGAFLDIDQILKSKARNTIDAF